MEREGREATTFAQRSTLDVPFVAGMALGLGLLYWAGALPLQALGLALFGALALARPAIGLAFVPLTAPLYLIPASIAGLRAAPVLLPLHEVALLVVAAAVGARWVWRRPTFDVRRSTLVRYAPNALLLLAGALGVLIAVERGPALRELRWLILEPLLFFGLLLWLDRPRTTDHGPRTTDDRPQPPSFWGGPGVLVGHRSSVVLAGFLLGGALVGLVGLLQYSGIDLVPLLGGRQCFGEDGGPCASVIGEGLVRRVTSVYGHPNNLGLFLGRVWPVAAALLLISGLASGGSNLRTRLFLGTAALLSLGGLVVSFSRGAWLGALAAAAALAFGIATTDDRPPTTDDRPQSLSSSGGLGSPVTRHSPLVARRPSMWLVAIGIALSVLAGLALSVRGDVTAGSTPARLLLWREALGYIRLHPLGIGLDQFIAYHDPDSGRSLIDPALLGTSEVYAAHPHNLLLDTWLRLGPLGLLAFGWLLLRFYREGRRIVARRHESPPVRAAAVGAVAAMTAAIVHGLVDNFYFVPDLAIAFWLLIWLVERADWRVQD